MQKQAQQCIYCTNHVSPASLPGISHVYIIRATINSISHTLSWAPSGSSKVAGVWCCPAVLANHRCEHQFALKAKNKSKRHDLIYQFLGLILRKANSARQTQHPTMNGDLCGHPPALECRKVLQALEGPWV